MSPALHKSRASAGGSTAAEFAIILPLAVVVMFGSIEAGRMVACRQMLTYATMDGARMAAAMGTANIAAVQTAVVGASPLLSITSANVTVSAFAGPCVAGLPVGGAVVFTARQINDCAQVRVNYTFTPALSGSWGNWLTSRNWAATQAMTVF